MRAGRRRAQLKRDGIVIPFFKDLRTCSAETEVSVCCSPVRSIGGEYHLLSADLFQAGASQPPLW